MKSKLLNKMVCVTMLLFVLMLSCKTKTSNQHVEKDQIVLNASKQNQQTAYPTEPGTCVIQAYILKIYPIDNTASDEPCKSFPCNAQIVITKTSACGYNVYRKPVIGDTLDVNFIHSLVSSDAFKKVYPAKVILSGLKQDQMFEAQIKIKLLPMEKVSYEIGNYEGLR